ncbi:hypothetical protein BGZ96_010893 [Linnemannia gamsii]|uniref:SGT1-domain-containing protein n=1 Tax=Linnemannia gamsii TaxID=64522 RepID=A0ABQ7JTR1_9FUNG|nr:hypothetical protein BGZ96_010893 [Linnemannia gamsii]
MDSSFPPHESIQEQRRALAEDTVSYAIYLPSSPTPTSTTSDSTIQIQNHATALESLQVTRILINSIVAELSKDYIWHKDAFSLSIASGQGKGSTGQPYLRGHTRFGDSIDDEWVVVHLLREITKRIPGSIARVQDNDGEFLLIEAADHIPAWLDPENSDNRVFIYQGNLHIIPIATTAEEKKFFPTTLGTKSRSPKLQDSLELIRSATATSTTGSTQISTLASTKIQQAAYGPLLPDSQEQPFVSRKIREQRHYARCQIPVQVARILKARPELITRAAEAFYTRDAIAMAVCSRMNKFLPTSATATSTSSTSTLTRTLNEAQTLGKNETPFVTTAVCFTKTCYAQLMGQQFQPSKIWDGIVPPPKVEDAQDPQIVREVELGLKLTCGFEILCSEEYPGDFGFKNKDDIQLESFPFATDDSWRVFKSNLTLRSYFGDERVGSAQYQQLEDAAKRQFLEYKAGHLQADEGQEDQDGYAGLFHGHAYHPVQEIDLIMDTSSATPVVDLKELVDDRRSDDDSWMDVDLQDLEDMMRARGFGGSGSSMETDQGEKSGLDMQQMLDRFGAFVEDGEGGVEGAEFLDEMSDDDEDDDNEDTDESDEDQNKAVNAEGGEAEQEEEEEAGDSDEDIFASDYEDKQAAKRAAKRRNKSGGGGAFLFDAGMMSFENGISSTTSTSDATKEAQAQAFAMDHGKFKDILVQTFGVPSSSPSSRTAAKESSSDVDSDSEEEDMDDEKLKEYMSALDAELSATKVGESFEKTTVSNDSKTTANSKEGKGKGVSRKMAPKAEQKTKKPEKNLEELMKEATDRSRRGFSRHGPLGMSSGPSFGYDPMGMSFADDEDDEEDEGIKRPRVATISADGEVGDELDELDDDEVEEMDQEMVDLELNLAKNLLESFKSQGGLPGPGGNLLSRLGIVLPRDDEDDLENDSE